jgi:hypothetical protein
MRKQAWAITKLAIKWRLMSYRLAIAAKRNPDSVGAASVDFLMFSGYAFMAFMWAQMSGVATRQLAAGEGDAEFLHSKLHTAEFFFQRILPRAAMHAKTMGANTQSVMAMPTSYFDAS